MKWTERGAIVTILKETFDVSRFTIPVSEKEGTVSAETYLPTKPVALLTLGHGAGSNMDQPFLRQLSAGLAELGVASIRYNFLYSEKRKKMPDRFPAASAVIRAVVDFARTQYPGLPLFCGGKSFGGRMSSMTLADRVEPGVRGLIFFGFPLHPAGSPSVERSVHLLEIALPMLFLQGTRDALATPELLRPIIPRLKDATLIEFEGADHSFKGGKTANPRALASAAWGWINKHT